MGGYGTKSAKTLNVFKKIESFYRGQLFREYLIDIFKMDKQLVIDIVNNTTDENSCAYMVSEFFDDIDKMCKVYHLSFIKNQKYRENLDRYISNKDVYKLHNMRDELKKEVDKLLLEKNFHNLDYYLADE